MPKFGDELHHFGWNACSSALCPSGPHPHVERRYLLVPGLRSSRIHVLDTKPDARQPRLVKVIEAEEVARKTGYRKMTLWTHSVLSAARAIYEKAGFTLTGSEKRKSWSQDVVAEFWDLEL